MPKEPTGRTWIYLVVENGLDDPSTGTPIDPFTGTADQLILAKKLVDVEIYPEQAGVQHVDGTNEKGGRERWFSPPVFPVV
jgi:hypothetical protein